MKYEKPEMELIELKGTDIITQSYGEGDYGDGSGEPVVKPPTGSWGQ